MQYIGIFAGNPTEGEQDGWEVSSGGLYTSPLSATLERNQTRLLACAVRCEVGYTCDSVTLTSNKAWLQLSVDGITFSNSITLTNIDDTNTLFFAEITGGADPGTANGSIALVGTVN